MKRRVSIDKDGKIPCYELKTRVKEGIKSAIRWYTAYYKMKPTKTSPNKIKTCCFISQNNLVL